MTRTKASLPMNNDDTFPCGSPKYPANTVKPIKPLPTPCGLFHALAELYGVNTKLPNAMDSLMAAIRASATNFRKLARLK